MDKNYKGANLKEDITSRNLKTRTQMTTTVKTDLLILMKEHSVQHKIPLSRLVDEAFAMFLREYGDSEVDQVRL